VLRYDRAPFFCLPLPSAPLFFHFIKEFGRLHVSRRGNPYMSRCLACKRKLIITNLVGIDEGLEKISRIEFYKNGHSRFTLPFLLYLILFLFIYFCCFCCFFLFPAFSPPLQPLLPFIPFNFTICKLPADKYRTNVPPEVINIYQWRRNC
jgi:hypothetical protein